MWLRTAFIAPISVLLLVGCAAIVGGGSKQKIDVTSSPEQASFTVATVSGLEIASGKTPQTVTLQRKREYIVTLNLDGYRESKVTLERGTNGWIWGNLLCGGLIGILVDFTSGAAYKLEPNEIHIELVTAYYENGKSETYAMFARLDDDGGLCMLPVPLIPDLSVAVAP